MNEKPRTTDDMLICISCGQMYPAELGACPVPGCRLKGKTRDEFAKIFQERREEREREKKKHTVN